MAAGRLSEKKIVILEASRFTYQSALSDIAGSDIAAHRNEPEEVVSVVRNWLANQCRNSAPGKSKIWSAFNECMGQLQDHLGNRGVVNAGEVQVVDPAHEPALREVECRGERGCGRATAPRGLRGRGRAGRAVVSEDRRAMIDMSRFARLRDSGPESVHATRFAATVEGWRSKPARGIRSA